jgi:hypothetical protein
MVLDENRSYPCLSKLVLSATSISLSKMKMRKRVSAEKRTVGLSTLIA